MSPLSTEERLALLLSVLGPDAVNAALKKMNPTRSNFIKNLLDEYKTDPPSDEEIEFIIRDFSRYFSFAMKTLGPEIQQASTAMRIAKRKKLKNQEQPVTQSIPSEEPVVFEKIDESGDYVRDLNQLDAFQISTALADDNAKTVALVVNLLETHLGAEIIKELDDHIRDQVIIYLSEESVVPERIVEEVLKTTFQKANAVTVKKETTSRIDTLAQLMRSLPKDIRKGLIEKLNDRDEEMVLAIRAKLYVFDDILRLDDRDTQKLIGQTKSEILAVALQQADPDVAEKLFKNVSKRARQAIEDEMEYTVGAKGREIEEARKQLVDAMARLDEAGDITLN